MSKRILTVDDSVSIRDMVAFTLRAGGYEVVEARSGEEALEKAGTQRFDAVLTDQNMPGMDGLSLVRALRAMPEYGRTPILLLTTESSPEMKAKGKAAAATGWLVKPFDPETLLSVIAKVLT